MHIVLLHWKLFCLASIAIVLVFANSVFNPVSAVAQVEDKASLKQSTESAYHCPTDSAFEEIRQATPTDDPVFYGGCSAIL